ncbi:hypothetical protein CDAR_372861 [Caerostris darwini]|uniref:Cyclase n=1 Tax=Caerostris darwini TaxID=1538125 RepID=A0AAV4RTH8_9ARAC|nr:hypothetical protein CDAR_372751 [Caerostris darwini]GIY24434.1 hypothetical protein CDAR_372861 [Caerostris darwini]
MAVLLLLLCSVAAASPAAKHMVDMTHVFNETTRHYYEMRQFNLTTLQNGITENGYWLRFEEYSSGIHVGTHMDAPAHFAETGLTIDQIPLQRLIAPAAVIDIRARAELDPDAQVTMEDLLKWESETGHRLDECVVLMNSGWGAKWGNQTAFIGSADAKTLRFPGISEEAALWLVKNRNAFGVGVDTLSLDRGISVNYEAHQVILGHGMYGMENVANLDQIPIYGATLYMLPMKIGNASGAPVRIIATFP